MRRITTIFATAPLLLSLLVSSAYSWTEYRDIRYMDLTGDLADEIIIKAKYGAGTNHYIEDIRIFQDAYPELKLIFQARTIDSYFGLESGNYKDVSEVTFAEPSAKNGFRDIIVKTVRIYYRDDENKVVDRKKDLGTQIFKWDGKAFIQ